MGFGDTKPRGLNWAGNDMVLVTNSATTSLGPDFTAPKYELTGTIIVPLDGGTVQSVFEHNRSVGHITQGHYGIRNVGGTWQGFFGGIALDVQGGEVHWRHGRTTLYRVGLPQNNIRVAAPPAAENHYRDWLIDAQGQVAVILDVDASNGTWRILNSRKDELIRGVDPTGDVGLLCFSHDGASVIYSVEGEDGNTRWFSVPLAGGTATEFLPDTSIDRFYTDDLTGQLTGYLASGENATPIFFDPKRQAAASKIFKAFRKWHSTLVDFTPDLSKAIVHTSGNGDSGTWFRVDVPKLQADPIGYDRLAIPPELVGPISTVEYKAADGLEMDGILTLPPAREPRGLPVIMLPHGGPGSYDEPGFDWWAQAFASRGYAVFQPNFRGSTNRDGPFRRAGYGQWGRKMQTDISDALAELARRGIVDPKRACIMGASYGGYAALAGVTLQHGLYRCAVSVAGVSDVEKMYNTDLYESGETRMMKNVLREELGDPKEYDSISPRRFASRADAPILLIHGKDDTVVEFNQSSAMADALKGAGKPYEMVVLKHEDHWLSRSETRKEMLNAAMTFVQKHNPAD